MPLQLSKCSARNVRSIWHSLCSNTMNSACHQLLQLSRGCRSSCATMASGCPQISGGTWILVSGLKMSTAKVYTVHVLRNRSNSKDMLDSWSGPSAAAAAVDLDASLSSAGAQTAMPRASATAPVSAVLLFEDALADGITSAPEAAVQVNLNGSEALFSRLCWPRCCTAGCCTHSGVASANATPTDGVSLPAAASGAAVSAVNRCRTGDAVLDWCLREATVSDWRPRCCAS
jgi:hypothetical protein